MSRSVIFFKSKACPYCQQLAPVFNKVAEKNKDTVRTQIVDITEDSQSAIDNGVMSVPTIIFFKDGVEAKRLSGVVSGEKIEQAIADI